MGRITVFTSLAYGFSWSYWGWILATGRVAAPGSGATHLPGLAGPALAALISVALFEGRSGLARVFRQSVTIPRRAGFAVLAMLAPPLLALAVLALTHDPFPGPRELFAYPGLATGTPLALGPAIVLILNGFGEEIGWRGELLPQLLIHMGRIPATLVMAALWAAWHLPVFTVNAAMTALIGPALAGWVAGLTLGAFVLAHLRLATGSILAVALWHVGYNYAVATTATAGVTAAVVSTAVMIWGLIVVIVWARVR